MRVVILAVLGVLVALQDTPAKTRFLQPKRPFVLSLSGSEQIHAQWLIARHKDNRKFRFEWNGPTCGGGWEDPIQGDDDASVFPDKPALIRVCAGENELRLLVYGPGNTIRDGAVMTVKVCGSITEDGTCS